VAGNYTFRGEGWHTIKIVSCVQAAGVASAHAGMPTSSNKPLLFFVVFRRS
jgi:hypothetical protein